MVRIFYAAAFCFAWFAWQPFGVTAQEPAPAPVANEATPAVDTPPKYMRLARDEDQQPLALETSIVRFAPADGSEGPTVDLIAVVHIGEQAYYEELNTAFDDYDAVLYELVAPEGTRIPAGGGRRSGHPISALQGGMQNMLELESQLAHIDYQRENFVHADMTPEDFEQSMRERGDNFMAMFFRMLGQSVARQALAAQRNPQGTRSNDLAMLLAFMRDDRAAALKRMMAEQFDDMGDFSAVFDGPDGSTIVTVRNQVALDVLRERIDGGDQKVAIFYGAGHMADFERQLVKQFGLERREERWLAAWDLGDGSSERTPEEAEPAATE